MGWRIGEVRVMSARAEVAPDVSFAPGLLKNIVEAIESP